jgi:hypothetical protein
LVVQVEQEQLLQFPQLQQLMLEVVAVAQVVLFQHHQVAEPLEQVVEEQDRLMMQEIIRQEQPTEAVAAVAVEVQIPDLQVSMVVQV